MNIRRRIAGIMAMVLAVTAFPYNTLPVYAMENDINIGEVVISTDSDDVINGEMIIEEPTVEISERNSYSEGQNIVLDEEPDDIVSGEDEIISEYEETDAYATEPQLNEDGNIASGSYGDVTWVIDANGKLIVRGTGNFKSVINKDSSYDSIPWYKYRNQINEASISIRNSEDLSGLLAGCENLKKADFSGTDTSKTTNMSGMFSCCYKMESVDLSCFDTSNVSDMSDMFYLCKNLKRLDLSNFVTDRVVNMSFMFYGCGMNVLNVSNFDTSKVEDMSEMFGGMWYIEELNLRSFNTSKVTDMSGMFATCESIRSLNINNFNTANVTNMCSMFDSCVNLAELNVAGFITSNVQNMDHMFNNCPNLTNLDLSSFDTASVTNMGCMFNNCSKLQCIDLTHFNTSKVTNMNHMFSYCSSLMELNLSNFDVSNVIYEDSSMSGFYEFFKDNTSLSKVKAPMNLKLDIELPEMGWENHMTGESVTKIPKGTQGSTLFVRGDIPITEEYEITVTVTGKGGVDFADEQGSSIIESQGVAKVKAGKDACFAFIQSYGNEDYSVKSLVIDGEKINWSENEDDYIEKPLGINGEKIYWYNQHKLQILNVQANHTLTVNFESKEYSGTFSYYSSVSKTNNRSSKPEDYLRSYTYNYSDDWFFNSSKKYNHDLAKLSLRTAMAAMDFADGSDEGSRKTQNIENLMKELGFKDISINYPKPEFDTIGSTIAYKNINKAEKKSSLILVTIRGAGYEVEWGGNFRVKESDRNTYDHAGWSIASNTVMRQLNSFIMSHKDGLCDDVKIWVVGYSRAAATANLVAARIIDSKGDYRYINDCGIDSDNNVFAYCFECPQNTTYRSDPHNIKYSGIFNIVNPLDFVPKVAMNNGKNWQFTRYGTTYATPSYLATAKYKKYWKDMEKVYVDELKIDSHAPKEFPFEEWLFDTLIGILADLTNGPETYEKTVQYLFIPITAKALGSTVSEEDDNAVISMFKELLTTVDENSLFKNVILNALMDEVAYNAKGVHFQELCLSWMDSISEIDLVKEKYVRYGRANCPVDVTIKDTQGRIVGKIVNDEPVEIEDGIFTIVDDDGQKIFALPGDDEYTVEFDATDSGEMTYSIVENLEGYNTIERVVSYSDVSIEKGDELIASVGEISETGDASYNLKKDNEEIPPTKDQKSEDVEFYSVDVQVVGNGQAEGSGTYTYGQFDRLIAQPNENARFLGWDVDGMIVSTDTEYRLEVTKDTVVSAVFTDKDTDKFYVGFDPQGGAPVKSLTDVAKGSTIKLPDTTRKGYELEGWYTEKDGKGNRFTEESAVNDNIVLYAYWKSMRVKGDVTGDGYVAMDDVVKTARAVAGNLKLTEEEKEAADVTGDNTVAMDDVVKEARYVAGAIKEL